MQFIGGKEHTTQDPDLFQQSMLKIGSPDLVSHAAPSRQVLHIV